jgi:hypothetical protein
MNYNIDDSNNNIDTIDNFIMNIPYIDDSGLFDESDSLSDSSNNLISIDLDIPYIDDTGLFDDSDLDTSEDNNVEYTFSDASNDSPISDYLTPDETSTFSDTEQDIYTIWDVLDEKLDNNIIIIQGLLNQDYCCICGYHKTRHDKKRHIFIKIEECYKCQTCGKFFFQHDHSKNPCFRPYKYIV